MTQRLKRWESPRRQGRNDKGKGGSARQRQLKKREKQLRKKLKDSLENQNNNLWEKKLNFSLFFGRQRKISDSISHLRILVEVVF